MPINVVVGALFLKDIRQQSDDDILESILFDVSSRIRQIRMPHIVRRRDRDTKATARTSWNP